MRTSRSDQSELSNRQFDGLTPGKVAQHLAETDQEEAGGKVKSGTMETTISANAEPELGE